MDLFKSMNVFRVVAEKQSFSQAAEHLNIVPSAVSRQISELEKWLGVRLINRTTRSLKLTNEGRVYLSKMEQIHQQVTELKAEPDQNQALKGTIQLTAPVMLGQFALPKALAEFKQLHPDITLSLSLMSRKVDIVEEGFDLALRVGHLADSTMVARAIGQLVIKTVASPAYIKQYGEPLHPKELSLHNCLVNNAIAKPKRWSFLIDDKLTQVKVAGDFESNESLCLKAFAQAGLGIIQLPELYVQSALHKGSLVDILPKYATSPLPIHLVYSSHRLLSPAMKALVDFLIMYFRKNTLNQLHIE